MNSSPGAGDEGFKYFAFISYNQRDGSWARWLHRSLEGYRTPRRLIGTTGRYGTVPARLFPVFRDREELQASADLGGHLRGCLAATRHLIVICSPRSAQSRWVNEEIMEFKRLGRSEQILALIIDGEPGAGSETECFPQALRFQMTSDCELSSVPTEPIAADVRPGKDAPGDAILKLIAGLLGLPFDALKQRETIRRRQRTAFWMVAGLLLIATGLAIWQFQERQKETAIRQQRLHAEAELAREQTAAATRLRQQEEQQRATVAEEDGRKQLAGGDALVAAKQLMTAHQLRPDDPDIALMLGVARRRLDGLAHVLPSDGGDIQDAFFSPAGQTVLLQNGGTLALWELESGRLLWRLSPTSERPGVDRGTFDAAGRRLLLARGDAYSVLDLKSLQETPLQIPKYSTAAFLGEGLQLIASTSPYAGEPGKLFILDAVSGAPIREFSLGPGGAVSFQSDQAGKTVLVTWSLPAPPGGQSPSPTIRWFEVVSGQILADVSPSAAGGNACLAPDGSAFAYERMDGFCEVYRRDGAKVTLADEAGRGLARGWSASGRGVVALSQPGYRASWWDPVTGRRTADADFALGAFDSREKWVADAAESGTITIHEVQSGRILRIFEDRIGWDQKEYHHQSAQFSPDGRYLLVFGEGSQARLWDWKAVQSEPLCFPGAESTLLAAAFAPDGSTLATAGEDHATRLWSLQSQEMLKSLEGTDRGLPSRIEFSADGKLLATESQGLLGGPVKIWQIATGQLHAEPVVEISSVSGNVTIVRKAPQGLVTFLKDRVITADPSSGEGALWEAATMSQISRFSVDPRLGIRALSSASKAGLFLVTTFKNKALIFQQPSSEPVTTLDAGATSLLTAGLDQAGRHAFTLAEDGRLCLWSIPDGKLRAELHQGEPRLNHAVISPDGRWVAAGAADGRAFLWQTESADRPLILERRRPLGISESSLGAPLDFTDTSRRVVSGMVRVLAAPSGQWLAGAHENGSVSVWNTTTGRQLFYFAIPSSRETQLVSSLDGRRIAVVGSDRTARVFELPDTPPPIEAFRQRLQALGQSTTAPERH